MANWKQIQGRIRRARTSTDPLGKLKDLFQKTRDPMVAYEVAALEEKAGRSSEAVNWYTTAATRFRRSDWRERAAGALARLGAPVPETPADDAKPRAEERESHSESGLEGEDTAPVETFEEPRAAEDAQDSSPISSAASNAAPSTPGERRKRRRGRRGGRRHRRKSGDTERAEHPGSAKQAARGSTEVRSREASTDNARSESVELEIHPTAGIRETAAPEFTAETPRIFERATYIRAGDPALSSRFAHLESLLRRLISAPLHRVEQADEAPAGPGVLLLSDSDLMTSYYIQSCKTLRFGAGQVAKPGRSRGSRDEKASTLRSRLAEHLEISENQAAEYLKKHCSLRWLQLDEEAPHLAHFAIAILRPALNTE